LAGWFLYPKIVKTRTPAARALIGKKLNLQRGGVSLATDNTIILFLSTECGYCKASIPFYRSLAAEPHHAPVFAAFIQPPSEGSHYLSSVNVHVDQVISPRSFVEYMSATPTLMIVNREGVVTDAWVGYLQPSDQKDILRKVSAGS
jgi:hypothetical protein